MSSGLSGPLGPREVDVRGDPLLLKKGEASADKDSPDSSTAPWSAPYTTMSPWSILLTGVYLPNYMFVMIFTLFTFLYHRFPSSPWLAVVLCLDIVVVAMWPPAHRWNGRGRWDWFPLLSGLLAIGLAVILGLLNYSNMEMWVHAKHLQTYNNLSPDLDPKSVSDAGVIRFAAGTVLDVASSAGYRAWPYTYCAAPVVAGSGVAGSGGTAAAATAAAGAAATAGATATGGTAAAGTAASGAASATSAATATAVATPQLVGFWAVGVNCCKSEGDFWCDGASDSQAHAGLRLESHWAGRSAGQDAGDYFTKAVQKAAAAQGLAVADAPVLLLWSKSPENVALRSWWMGVCVYIVLVLLAICTSYGFRVLFNLFMKARNVCK